MCWLYLPFPLPAETKDSITASRFKGTFRGTPRNISHIFDVDMYRGRVVLIGSGPRNIHARFKFKDSSSNHKHQGALVDPEDPRDEKFAKRSWSHDFARPKQHTCLCRWYWDDLWFKTKVEYDQGELHLLFHFTLVIAVAGRDDVHCLVRGWPTTLQLFSLWIIFIASELSSCPEWFAKYQDQCPIKILSLSGTYFLTRPFNSFIQ